MRNGPYGYGHYIKGDEIAPRYITTKHIEDLRQVERVGQAYHFAGHAFNFLKMLDAYKGEVTRETIRNFLEQHIDENLARTAELGAQTEERLQREGASTAAIAILKSTKDCSNDLGRKFYIYREHSQRQA